MILNVVASSLLISGAGTRTFEALHQAQTVGKRIAPQPTTFNELLISIRAIRLHLQSERRGFLNGIDIWMLVIRFKVRCAIRAWGIAADEWRPGYAEMAQLPKQRRNQEQ